MNATTQTEAATSREQLTNVTTESIDQRCAEFSRHAFYCAEQLHLGVAGDNTLYGFRIRIHALANRIIALRCQELTHTCAVCEPGKPPHWTCVPHNILREGEAKAQQDAPRLHWLAGDYLTVSAHKSDPGRGLTYAACNVIASEDGFPGGWDVFEGRTQYGREVSFYGFSVTSAQAFGEVQS